MTRRSKRNSLLLLLLLSLVVMATHSSDAGWLQHDVPVCTDVRQQQHPAIAPDGQGGSLVAWEDARSFSDVFAQRYDADGNPLWQANGINVSDAKQGASTPAIAPDGTGGAYIAFLVDSAFCANPYCVGDPLYMEWNHRMTLARIAPDGSLIWKKHLAPIAPGSYADFVTERYQWMVPDGGGGIIIIWEMAHGFTPIHSCPDPPAPCHGMWAPSYLYAQRFDAQGNRLWGSSPVRISSNATSQGGYNATSDASGNIIIAWADYRNEDEKYGDVYAQKIDPHGNLLWAADGVSVITYPTKQIDPCVAPDGSGGAFVTWKDSRSALNPDNINIYAQRLDSSGRIAWAPEGMVVTQDFGRKNSLGIIRSTPGTCIIFWSNADDEYSPPLYAQRMDSTGNALWQSGGRQFSEGSSKALNARGIPLEDGGAVFAWEQEETCYDGCALRGVWGSSATDIFAVGDRSLIYHYDGTSWSKMENPAKYYHLKSVWGTAPDNVYAVGDAILHYDGEAWHKENSPAGYYANLRGIWGSGPDDIYAVGWGIDHFDGTSWSKVDSTGWTLWSVCGTSSTNVYAVGDDFIVHYDGVSWQKTPVPYTKLSGIWVSPDNHIFISTYQGMIHNDGSGWAVLPLNAHWAYGQGVWGDSANNVYAVFDLGFVLHYDGVSATTTQAASTLYGIWGIARSDTSGNIWVCGHPRCIRRLVGSEWVPQYETSGTLCMNRVDSAGNALWNDFGAPISDPGFAEQTQPSFVLDGEGNALLAWRDSRNINYDIYARKVSISRGPLVATELLTFAADPIADGILVSWRLSQYDEGASFSVARCEDRGGSWHEISPGVERSNLAFSFNDSDVRPGVSYRYRVEVVESKGSRLLFETESIPMPILPLALHRNFPNPFNPSTTIRYELPAKCRVTLNVYDISGRLVARLVDVEQTAGTHSFEWNGKNDSGGFVASGVYVYRLRAGKEMRSHKMVLLK